MQLHEAEDAALADVSVRVIDDLRVKLTLLQQPFEVVPGELHGCGCCCFDTGCYDLEERLEARGLFHTEKGHN